MKRRNVLIMIGLTIVIGIVSYWMGIESYKWMPPEASAEAVLIDSLFSLMVSVGTFIFLGVTGTLLFSIVFHRAAKYDFSDGPPIEGNTALEIFWTAVPFMTIVAIGTYSFQIYQKMSILGPTETVSMMPAAIAAPLPTEERSAIEVRSRQWAWEFYYPEQDVSSTELHVPVNERAKLLLQSEDVLHGLYIPAFRVKQDIIPGRQIEFEFTPIREGRYRLRDSEHSGTYSGANQTNVVVESPEAFEKWLAFAAEQPRQAAENAAYDQYKASEQNPISLGWESIKPAPAPVVNFASSDKDPYE